ncbi:MAG: transcription termination factor Rho [Gemmatimonadota bacterium]|nr:transcription termination factor Rho [Gemmatimonadota bacterium]
MNERRRPTRRGRGHRPPNRPPLDSNTESSPYRDDSSLPAPSDTALPDNRPAPSSDGGDGGVPASPPPQQPPYTPASQNDRGGEPRSNHNRNSQSRSEREDNRGNREQGNSRDGGSRDNGNRDISNNANGRRGRRGRQRSGPRPEQQSNAPVSVLVADGTTIGWFDSARDGGFVRRAEESYLPSPNDAFVPSQIVKQFAIRRGDLIEATTGRDQRGRLAVAEVEKLNGGEPDSGLRRPDFSSLIASYPERKLTLETGQSAKIGPELTRRAIDLIAPIGYGQRALIVAPARAGKTMLLQAITEGIAINHPEATLLVLLVDERPEEVSEMIEWGRGEVVASSFDQPAERHVDVADMTLERARRLVEQGKDVVIVLDSITRLARAHNTAERGTGRTLSGGLDATAMAKPKAFFGSARSVSPANGGGSLTIIATALVETGSRMDDVIFEEFKGTGNSEIKLDRGLAEKRVFPAIDVATSGTRREDKLFRPDQIDAIFTLRRGLQQMPPQAGMEWLIKRIQNTANNDTLLSGL